MTPPTAHVGLVELGRAVTRGQALPLGVDDPVIAARAVRRALASARRQAADVTDLIVAAASPISAAVAAGFARRALGPHGSDVRTLGVVSDDPDPSALADIACAACEDILTSAGAEGVVVVVGLAPDGTTEARCLTITAR
jgi:hypothetical protein